MKLRIVRKCLVLCMTALLLSINLSLPALAAPGEDTGTEPETGWIEAKASVPEGFKGVVILSMENQDTLEEYDVDCLRENGYVGSKVLPAGPYQVSMAFVYQNYTYTVKAEPSEFTVPGTGAAVPIALTVTAPQAAEAPETPVAEPEPAQLPEQEPEVPEAPAEETVSEPEAEEPTHTATETVAEEKPAQQESSRSLRDILTSLVLGLLGALVFAAVVFGACWLYRRYMENNS